MRIQVIGVKQALTNMDNYLRKVYTGMTHEIVKGAQDMKRTAQSYTPVDLGELRDSIGVKTSLSPKVVTSEVSTNVSYAPPVEYGSRPHTPPLQNLEGWADRHHIPAFLVQRSIAQKGTRPNFMMTRGYEMNYKKVIRGVAKVVRKA
jgi:hypothetical protein